MKNENGKDEFYDDYCGDKFALMQQKRFDKEHYYKKFIKWVARDTFCIQHNTQDLFARSHSES